MTRIAEYVGDGDSRIITSAEFTAAGLSSPTLTWNKQNGFENSVSDEIAAWLTAIDPRIVVDPPANFGELLSGAVKDYIADGAAGFFKSMDPKSALSAFVVNQTTEVSALNAVFSMPRITNEAVFKMTAWGICRCTAGGPVNMTVRLKNLTDSLTLCTATVSLIVDADGNRPWTFEVDGSGQFVLADSVVSGCRLEVGAGSGGAAPVFGKGQAVVGWGTDPQNWDLTAQFSVANAGILANIYGAMVMYGLPGA